MRLPTDEEVKIIDEINEKEKNGTLTPEERERLEKRLGEVVADENWPFV